MRIIRGDPVLGPGVAVRIYNLQELGRRINSSHHDIIFMGLADGTTVISYSRFPDLQGVLYNDIILQSSSTISCQYLL